MDREPVAEVIADEAPGQLAKEQPPLTDLALLFGLHYARRAIPAGFRIEHRTTTGRRDYLLRSKQTNSGMGRLKPDVLVLRGDRAAAVIDAKYNGSLSQGSGQAALTKRTFTSLPPTPASTSPSRLLRSSTRATATPNPPVRKPRDPGRVRGRHSCSGAWQPSRQPAEMSPRRF
jgi:hypothetical protein